MIHGKIPLTPCGEHRTVAELEIEDKRTARPRIGYLHAASDHILDVGQHSCAVILHHRPLSIGSGEQRILGRIIHVVVHRIFAGSYAYVRTRLRIGGGHSHYHLYPLFHSVTVGCVDEFGIAHFEHQGVQSRTDSGEVAEITGIPLIELHIVLGLGGTLFHGYGLRTAVPGRNGYQRLAHHAPEILARRHIDISLVGGHRQPPFDSWSATALHSAAPETDTDS